MREILFRGKTAGGEWVQGDLHNAKWKYDEEPTLLIWPKNIELEEHYEFFESIEVIPETVGQYTGLTDKNGTKIFEGDIVLFPWGEKREVFSVEFVEGEFEAIPKRKSTDIWCIRIGSYAPEFEVIGNIHDNPEVLKEVQNEQNHD